ncbi:caffeic acid 3-O-methyltransferase 1-like [Phalaenopsis equestris]|uniref:caffeic acid 3-O-methyltransferase 1-like n=1 Tax=Phalaenopsis equestris TaxID=78828 RepID=UPI0009E5D836|nr:caffeic acid 3-O-methyltransferase 1-like [Phalaenopsis equestris]
MSDTQREDEEPFIAAMLLCYSKTFSRAVQAAFDLGIFEVLAEPGPKTQLTAREIAGNLSGCNHEKAAAMLDNILGYLASHSILTCTASSSDETGSPRKQYGLTPTSRLLAKNHDGLSLAPFMFMSHKKVYEDACWNQLKEALQEGVNPFKKAYGFTMYEYMDKNPTYSKVFNEGMASNSNIVTQKMLEKYEGLKQVTELVDVGGGIGTSLKNIISKYPHIKGINFDLPHVVSQAPSLPGVQHVGGDMFIMIPSGEAIFLKWILHNWNDEKCLLILKNCWKALPTSGKVILMEHILPEFPETNISTQQIYTMNMIMTMFFEAKVRTEREYQSLAHEAGFSGFKILCKIFNYHIMEFLK